MGRFPSFAVLAILAGPGASAALQVGCRALIQELRLRGIPVAAQATFPVAYKGKHISTYTADVVVDGRLLVEIKCVEQMTNELLAQCINYLKASGLHLALLFNFRKTRVEWRRVVYNL